VTLGNKDGDVTFVEFFDYNCGYCKRAMLDMMELNEGRSQAEGRAQGIPGAERRLGRSRTSRVAVRMQDPTGKKYLDFHQKLLGGRGAADKARAMAVAKEVGLDMARLEKDLASAEVAQYARGEHEARRSMGMNGTPSYVIASRS